jgi:UDP-glucuronate 4-epimerase
MNQRILITGAAGFIGSNLADNLLDSGFRVMGIDNFDPFYDRSVKEANISSALRNELYDFREGDIRDSAFIDSCLIEFKPDILIHLAAKAGVRPSLIDALSYYDVNVMGTLNILELMNKNGIKKMLFASSSSVYGNNKKIPFSESDNVDYPVSPYAASKKAGELLCHTYHHLYDIDIYCLRFFTVYGPRQRPDLAINKFTSGLLAGKEIPLYGDGTTSRDYTHIEDIIQGIKKAGERVKGFDIFNLGESKTISLTGLVSLLEKATGRKAATISLPLQEGDVVCTYADISKAKNMLGYNPVVDIETGIKRYIKWYKESGYRLSP